MTIEVFEPAPIYDIQGIGPYAIPHPYEAGAIRAAIIYQGEFDDLTPVDFNVVPMAAAIEGNLFLTPAAAARYAGRRLAIMRDTDEEQGWAGILGERERGLETQLDRIVMILQELSKDLSHSIRGINPMKPFVPEDGHSIVFEDGNPAVGPDVSALTYAEAYAERAEAAAEITLAAANFTFPDRQSLLADTRAFGANTVIQTRREGEAFEVAPTNASDHHFTTAGGVKLYEMGPLFSTRARLAQAVSRGRFSEGRVVFVRNRRYRVDELGIDGLCIVDADWSGRFETLQARALDGQALAFACYGDSTTDGNQTTGWTANPTNGSGDAIGGAAHTPPNAWPAEAQSILRAMTKNSNISFWNAGYGGKDLVTGWARRNFLPAIINNPAYGVPNACLFAFGLNDMVRPEFSLDAVISETTYLFNLCDFHNIVPIVLTPDPVMQGTPRQGGQLQRFMSMMRRVAEQFGVTVIDNHRALSEVFSASGTNELWAYHQPDGLHFTDTGHRMKGAHVAACLFANTLWLDETRNENVAAWSRHCNSHGNTYSLYTDVNNAFGASMNISAGTYAVGDVLLDLWCWTKSSNIAAFWRSVDGEGFYSPRPLASAPVPSWGSYLNGANADLRIPTAGNAQGASLDRESETPCHLAEMTAGLNRLRYKAPLDTNANQVFLGYFSFRSTQVPRAVTGYWPPSRFMRASGRRPAHEQRKTVKIRGALRDELRKIVDIEQVNHYRLTPVASRFRCSSRY
ncbi:SGNH/GDSL hydrolase family protein [Paracoccus marinaquae]|uniref:SGNH/GDSL hydrolase family protein n=1 Tax=Paracoccus marinaquae TaxID=2841926 RepID=A0ABS6AL92_9RHOB|nr:SGNH/GDSL hydrolase family protein [Paracoccus marinaquae]MBU3031358.1 SGNH/GDSL hydrolase family protein [Paracoccus marinaquae]